jgi:hypothetical protein
MQRGANFTMYFSMSQIRLKQDNLILNPMFSRGNLKIEFRDCLLYTSDHNRNVILHNFMVILSYSSHPTAVLTENFQVNAEIIIPSYRHV